MSSYEEHLSKVGKERVEETPAIVETKKEETIEAKVEETPIVETPAVEVTQEAVVETETIVEETTPKSFIELAAEAAGRKLEEEKPVEEVVPESIKTKLEELSSKLDRYENDPLVKAVSVGATIEQLYEIALEMKGTDFTKLGYKDLVEMELKSLGLDGDDLAEAIEVDLAEFNEQPIWKQKKQENELRAKYKETAKQGESETLKSLQAAYQEKLSGIKTPEQLQQEFLQTIQMEKEAIKNVGTKSIGGEMHGVVFTQEELNDILEKEYHPEKVTPYLDENGNLQADKFIIDKFKLRNFDKMIQNEVERQKNKQNIETAAPRGKATGAPLTVDTRTEKQKLADLYGYPANHPMRREK